MDDRADVDNAVTREGDGRTPRGGATGGPPEAICTDSSHGTHTPASGGGLPWGRGTLPRSRTLLSAARVTGLTSHAPPPSPGGRASRSSGRPFTRHFPGIARQGRQASGGRPGRR
ncbi:hypothetical protein GCM10027091_03790 [Streptomyces daliensis]